jgi:hypothetical protein
LLRNGNEEGRLIGGHTFGEVRASVQLAIIGEPSPMTMSPNRSPDPVLDADCSPARTSARTAGRIVSVNISVIRHSFSDAQATSE